jgi:metallo-beta-lactamase class B
MKKIYLILILTLIILSVTSCVSKDVESSDAFKIGEMLTNGDIDSNYIQLVKVEENLWVHTSYDNYNGKRTSSNGMLINTSEGLILIDTPWNDEQTKELIKLAKDKFNKDFALAIITHAHVDRIGGINTLLDNKIEVRSTKLTAGLAESNGFKRPNPVLDINTKINLGDMELEVFYPGEGHSPDNITVWIPQYKVLFGGCLIKSLESEKLGINTDSKVDKWPDSVQAVKEKYADIHFVIPGHGDWGGNELIEHTLDLLKEKSK